jgi:hypothetical protein
MDAGKSFERRVMLCETIRKELSTGFPEEVL